jgi:hypothetical protein
LQRKEGVAAPTCSFTPPAVQFDPAGSLVTVVAAIADDLARGHLGVLEHPVAALVRPGLDERPAGRADARRGAPELQQRLTVGLTALPQPAKSTKAGRTSFALNIAAVAMCLSTT